MEATMNDSVFLPGNYMNVLLGMSDDTKLRIIRMLTDSLLRRERIAVKSPSFTSDMLEKHAGSWVGDESADEIMSTIRENSTVREPLKF